MNLTNPNKPVTEARLQEFYHRIKNFLGFTEMPSEDMTEVVSPIPGVMSRLPVLFDETGAEYQVGWYKYANGTKQPIYEKIISDTLPNVTTEGTSVNKYVSVGVSIKKYVESYLFVGTSGGNHALPNFWVENNVLKYYRYGLYNDTAASNANKIMLTSNATAGNGLTVYVMIRYTKTTDTPQ